MIYSIIEEASEAICYFTTDLQDAINKAKSLPGKYLVFDENDKLLFDSKPGISYKI